MTIPIDDITKQDFEDYEAVRESGVVNMMDPRVQSLAGIDRDTHLGILKHYEELCAKWPDVREPQRTDD